MAIVRRTDVSEEHIATIFRVRLRVLLETHGVISQKTIFFK
jgi:hypothetical protein